VVLGIIYKVFALKFFTLYLLFLGSILVFALYSFFAKKGQMKQKFVQGLSGTLGALYSSNLGKWKMNAYILFIIFSSSPLVFFDVKGFLSFHQDANSLKSEVQWPNKAMYFEDESDQNQRFSRIRLESDFIKSDKASIQLAYYAQDVERVEEVNNNFPTVLDTLGWEPINEATDFYRFYLNDSLLTMGKWNKATSSNPNQKVYENYLDLSGIETGYYELRVKKLSVREALFSGIGEIRVLDRWAVIRFYKE
jgi:hypothetical protein